MPSQIIVHHDFFSETLASHRTVVVYLPSGYGRDTRRQYPLLFVHDGQNIFDPATAYVPGQHWRLRETADDLLARRRIEPLIIAAVYHAGAARLFEYTPTRTRKLDGGGVAIHERMMVDELRPWLRERYRIMPHARHTGLAGSSLGGLATLCLGLDRPEVFGKLAVMSPSVWWDHRVILKIAQRIQQPQRQRIWLDVGTEEGSSPFTSTRDVRLLKATLVSKGWREGQTLHYLEDQGADHSERAWAARAPAMLEWLYPRRV